MLAATLLMQKARVVPTGIPLTSRLCITGMIPVTLEYKGMPVNTATNEMHAIEAYYNYEQYPYLAVPVLGQPAVPYMVRYDANSGNNPSTVHQGIRRNYLGTINDLDAPVQKTADKTMKITYTLRREES